MGDDPAWAAKNYDHQDWDFDGSSLEVGLFWVRFKINMNADLLDRLQHKGIRMISLGAYEAYWDGEFIGGSGKVGVTKAEEVPAKFYSYLLIPDSLAGPGEHTLALRLSNHYSGNYASWNSFYVSEYVSLGRIALTVTAYMFILGGIFLSAGFYYLLLFFRSKDRARLIFGLMCLLFFSLLIIEYWKFIYYYEYPFQTTRLFIIGSITLLLSFLTPWFFIEYFESPRSKLILLIYGLSLIVFLFFNHIIFDSTNMKLGLYSWILTLLIVGYAWWEGKAESHIVLAVLLIFYVIPELLIGWNAFGLFLYNYDLSLFLSFALLVFTQLYLLAKRSKAQQLAYEATLIRSSRLQNELLRKNIQPHFLMNTLTALIDEVEQSPKESVAFIEALAEEFSAFHAIAEKTNVELAREVHLCKSHLSVMRHRKEMKYEWTEADLDYTQTIPPGVLLTIVENGITHSKPGEDGVLRFHLSYQFDAPLKEHHYELDVYGKNRADKRGLRTGTGMNYVRSRLEESYGQNWSLEGGAIDNGWRTTIIIKA